MTNYQGVRRLKKYLKNEYGVGSRDFGSYKRYSGYEKIYFFDSNDIEMTMTIRAYVDSVWITFDQFDADGFRWVPVGRCKIMSLEEFHKITDGGKIDEAVVKDPDPVLPDCQEEPEFNPDALPFGESYVVMDFKKEDDACKLPVPCCFCPFACKDFNIVKRICSYGENSNDYLIRESSLPCKGEFKIL